MRQPGARNAGLMLALTMVVAACASAPRPTPPSAGTSTYVDVGSGPIGLVPIVYAEDAFIRDAVRDECQAETKLTQFIEEYADEQGIEVFSAASTDAAGTRTLTVTISDITETGNAWVGRQKSVTIKGTLTNAGDVVGSFRGRRATSGGYYGAYKGNCAFVGRCVKALGRDVARWLQAPAMKSQIGE